MAALSKTYQVCSHLLHHWYHSLTFVQFQSPDLWKTIPAGLNPLDLYAFDLAMMARKSAA